MKNKVVILHAWFENPKTQWYQWLRVESEKKGHEVVIPPLPTMDIDLPDLEKLISAVSGLIGENTVVVGHSLGAVLALRLGERKKYGMLISVAGWDYDDLYPQHRLFWKNKINHDLIKQNVGERFIFHSDNDPYLTTLQAENMSKRLDGKLVFVKGAGHFTKDDGISEIPQILQFL